MSKHIATPLYNNLPFSPDMRINKAYILSDFHMETLTGFLCSITSGQISELFENASDNIISMRIYPFNIIDTLDIPSTAGAVSVKIGNLEVKYKGSTLYAYEISSAEKYNFSAGSFDVPGATDSYLDLSPYTQYELFLPYYGYLSIDPAEINNYHIDIEYIIDFNSGGATIVLQRQPISENSYNKEKYEIFRIIDCKIAIDIPLLGSNASEVLRNNLASGASVLGSIVTAAGSAMTGFVPGIAGGITGAIAAGNAMISANQRRYNSGEMSGQISPLFLPQNPILYITRLTPEIPENYNHLFGKPCGRYAVLSELTGFTKVSIAEIEGFATALQNEKKEVEQLLKEGIEL